MSEGGANATRTNENGNESQPGTGIMSTQSIPRNLAAPSGRRRPFALAAALACLCVLGAAAQPSSTPAGQSTPGKAPAKGSAAKPGAPASGAAAPAGSAGAASGGAAKGPAGAPAAAGAPPASGAAGSPGTSTLGTPPADMGNIDQILEGDEQVLAGGNTFTYDPGNRRDPFKSLLIAPDRPEFRGPRPEGIPGLLIDEIDIKGIFRTARGYVAQVNASNQKKSYLLKEGDQLFDGDVMSIGKNEVVFKQIVQDPTALKPFREVVKSLNPG